jgi:hypothetical protein
MEQYSEYFIEYDRNMGSFWVSGLNKDRFWIDLEYVQVFDDPYEKIKEYVSDLQDQGHFVSIEDITDIDDTYTEEDDQE